jgi:hypothetical protein
MEAKTTQAKLGSAALLAVVGGLFLSLMALTSTAQAETPLLNEDGDAFYDIATCQDLQNVAYDLTLDYELTGNINCAGTNPSSSSFDPSGLWSDGSGFAPLGDLVSRFKGEFDGHGHAIQNLYIDRSDTDYVGLFGIIDEGSSVHDLVLSNVDITGNGFVGALAGALSGTVTNASSSGHVEGDSGNIGGLVGLHVTPSGIGSSSPLVFTWDGTKYRYMADVGRGIPRNVVGNDPTPLDDGSLVPTDGAYSVKVTEEYNEIVYYDELALKTYDHAPGYDIATSIVRATNDAAFTISETPSNPLLSCADMFGNDCLDTLKNTDDTWSYDDGSTHLNYLTMNFGDLSAAEHITLIMKGARNFSQKTGSSAKAVQVKNASGNWINAYTEAQLQSLGGTPLNRIIDLTGKFPTSDYTVRIGFGRTRFDSFAIDTSAQVPVTVNTYHPASVDLGFHGYTAIDKTNYWKHDFSTVSDVPEEMFATQRGNFTKYGDVTPLLQSTNDQFVIMHHGDMMDVSFPYVAPADGLERSSLIYSWATFKHAHDPMGDTVDLLPFNGMSVYPYPETESYPMTPENAAYLAEYNTRVFTGNPSTHSTIIDSYSDAQVEGNSSSTIGGLVGNNLLTITGSHATGAVHGYYYVGGLVGSLTSPGAVTESYATGNVNGYYYVGGLVGYGNGGSNITRSYAKGDVTATGSYVGGLLGISYLTATDSYARGAVSGSSSSYVGGFAGNCGSGSIAHSFSTGAVSGDISVGGFLGSNSGCTSDGNFWDVTTSGTEGSASGIGLETASMKDAGTFLDAGWDLDTVWALLSSQNNGYPHLQALPLEVRRGTNSIESRATVSLPNGGETLEHGTTYMVFYGAEGSDVQEARLSLSTNGGTTWTTIADHQTLGGGYFIWTVPDVDTDAALIRVEAMSSGTVRAMDVSDATFTIRGTANIGSSGQDGVSCNIGSSGQDGVSCNIGSSGQDGVRCNIGSSGQDGVSVCEGEPTNDTNDVNHRTVPPGGVGDPDFDLLFVRPEGQGGSPACTPGSRIKGSTEAVYYCGDDGMRHAFPNVAVYHSWFTDFSGIVTLSDEELSKIPLGRNMTYRSGSRLVKIQTDPMVYLVEHGAVLRPIESEETATLFFGPDWASFVDDMDVSFFANYTMGETLRAREFTGHVTLIK